MMKRMTLLRSTARYADFCTGWFPQFILNLFPSQASSVPEVTEVVTVADLSDEQLYDELVARGVSVGPIVGKKTPLPYTS